MTSIILWLMGKGLSEKLARAVVIGTAVVAIFAACVGLKACYDHRIISDHDQQQTVEILKKAAPSNDKAAEARASDTIQNEHKDEVRHEAIAKETDETPTDASVALGCARLREAGYDTRAYPSCRGR